MRLFKLKQKAHNCTNSHNDEVAMTTATTVTRSGIRKRTVKI